MGNERPEGKVNKARMGHLIEIQKNSIEDPLITGRRIDGRTIQLI
jgi:hypothetical protein